MIETCGFPRAWRCNFHVGCLVLHININMNIEINIEINVGVFPNEKNRQMHTKKSHPRMGGEIKPVKSWPFVLFSVLMVLGLIVIIKGNADKAPQRVRVFSRVSEDEGVAVSIVVLFI